MRVNNLLKKALDFRFLSKEEGIYLFRNLPAPELVFVANELRKIQKPDNKVTWIIDRNVNTTNVCVANCKFCNFFVPPGKNGKGGKKAYITTIDEYKEKIEETFRYGGNQLLLQGGHHPELGLKFYTDLFNELKNLYPELRLHALSPPEIAHLCSIENRSPTEILSALKDSGLDTFPGAGAEILNNRVRKIISRGKCTGEEWLEIMHAAHKLYITTSATMMFGHIETLEERFEHLVLLRDAQARKPDNAKGFLAFIPWPFQDEGTLLKNVKGVNNTITSAEYVKMIAISRIMLPNIINIQASWLTVGAETAQLCLHAGANDLGSIMIEENVVSAAGAPYRFTSKDIQAVIKEAGFEPQLRTQEYEYRELPEDIEQQVIGY